MSGEEPYGFIMSVYPRPISCFGADAHISLLASMRQVSSRRITNLRLKRLLLHSEPTIILAVKMILGSGHLNREEYPRDNTNISSRFITSLLELKLAKQAVWSLTKKLFPDEILQELQEILSKALHDSGAPRPSDRIVFNVPGELIKYYPFLLDLKGKDLDKHRAFAGMGLSYLKWRFIGENPEDLGKEEELLLFATLNGILPPKVEEEEPQVERGRRGGARRVGCGSGRSRGQPPCRCRGRGRTPTPPAEPLEEN